MNRIRLAMAVAIVGLVIVGVVLLAWLGWATQGRIFWLFLLAPIILAVAITYDKLGGKH